MVSQDTDSGEMEEPVTVRVPEIVKKVPRVPNKDKEPTNNEGSVKGRKNEIKQTSTDLNQVREAYFNLIQTQRKKMSHAQEQTVQRKEQYKGR